MVKRLLTLGFAAAALSATATSVVDYEIDYSKYDKFPFYVMGYTPTFEDGVMKASYPGEWYQFFMADAISINSAYTYTVTVKVKSSQEGSLACNMGWGWEDGQKATGNLKVTTDWAEQTVEFHNVGTGNANVVLQPGSFAGDLEFSWLRVSHEDTSLDPALQCMIIDNIPASKTTDDGEADLDLWECCAQYNFTTPLEPGTYAFSYDTYGLQDGGAYIWGTVGGAGWYGGGGAKIAKDKWTSNSGTFTIEQEMTMLQFVFGSLYKGKTLYFDNFVLTKVADGAAEGGAANLIANGDFAQASAGQWSRPGYHSYSLFVGNGPAHPTSDAAAIEDDTNVRPVYYTMQGILMPEGTLPAGIYIKVTGSKSEKVVIR